MSDLMRTEEMSGHMRESPFCYLWLGNMPTSAGGADMLERWLEKRLLPMAPIRYASCSLTTLGMLTESSRRNLERADHFTHAFRPFR